MIIYLHSENNVKIGILMMEKLNKTENIKLLPFQEYILNIKDEDIRIALKEKMKGQLAISDATMSRYVNGNVRPDILKRKEIAKIIRRHSGDGSYTADNLFPVEFYE